MPTKYKIEYFIFHSFVSLFRIIGLRRTRVSAKYLAYLLYYLIPVRKEVVRNNLKIALPTRTDSEINKLTLLTYQNILITFFELMYLPSVTREEIESSIFVENMGVINKLVGTNKAAIILTGHFGGWELCMSSLTLKFGREFSLLAQPQSNPFVSDFVMRAREKFGNRIILSGNHAGFLLYESIKNGGIVGIAGDQRGTYKGPRFNFFGRPTALYTGMASISLKTNCLVFMTAFERRADYSYVVHLEELSFIDLPNSNVDKIRELTQRYISFLEKHIRKNPEQYFWMHKIWKY